MHHLTSGERQQILVCLVRCREILGFPFPAQRKEVAVRPIISRSAVNHSSDRAGEFFIIHMHFLSNKKTSYPCISTQIARYGCHACPRRSRLSGFCHQLGKLPAVFLNRSFNQSPIAIKHSEKNSSREDVSGLAHGLLCTTQTTHHGTSATEHQTTNRRSTERYIFASAD